LKTFKRAVVRVSTNVLCVAHEGRWVLFGDKLKEVNTQIEQYERCILLLLPFPATMPLRGRGNSGDEIIFCSTPICVEILALLEDFEYYITSLFLHL